MIDLTVTKRRLQGWSNLLSAGHKAAGLVWYADAKVFAQEVAKEYGLDLDRVVGVLAVLSVQNRWDQNKVDTENLIRAFAEGIDLSTVSVATYSGQKHKAIAILRAAEGADISLLIGTKYAPKTRAFYDNILHPEGSPLVTLDRWIFRGLGLEAMTVGGGNRMIALYRALSLLFVEEARALGLRPCQYQAAVWVCIQSTALAEGWEGSRPSTGVVEEAAPF
jgi:hypothetical protein